MRHSHRAPGSPAAQADLWHFQAGCTSSRRGFLSSLLVASAATTAAGAAAALAIPSSVPTMTSVSPRMSSLIAAFQTARANLDTLPDDAGTALTALVNERPGTLADFAAKTQALASETQDDTEDYIVRRLAEDAARLQGVPNDRRLFYHCAAYQPPASRHIHRRLAPPGGLPPHGRWSADRHRRRHDRAGHVAMVPDNRSHWHHGQRLPDPADDDPCGRTLSRDREDLTMADQLTFGLLILDPQAHRILSMRKERKCLSCLHFFPSSTVLVTGSAPDAKTVRLGPPRMTSLSSPPLPPLFEVRI